MVKESKQTQQKPLRLWPGVVAVVLLILARFGLKIVMPGFEGFSLGMMGGIICSLLVLIWWAFFSRAQPIERWGAILLMIVAIAMTWYLNHVTMGPLWAIGYGVPFLLLAFVVWAVVTRSLHDKIRRITMVANIVLACGVWLLFRTGGIDGDHVADFSWRWTESPEERLVAQSDDELTVVQAAPIAMETEAEWPGFRGPNRNSIIPSTQIETNWSVSPPVELWRRPIGPGWGSFAVHGDLFYTQEQRGENEVVSCYKIATGELVWRHSDTARFFESNGGAGPRGTPTLHEGLVYTFGATGIVNALYARDGSVKWSRNAGSDTETKIPIWGFASSPLVVDDVVIIAASSSLIAYDLANGEPRWFKTIGNACYSSPHLINIDGVNQILLLNETGAIGVATDSKLLWEHSWPGGPIVQPAQIANGDILITATERSGVRRIAIMQESGEWSVEERWTSIRLKPYFNDFVVHEGYAFGFDGRILACIDLENGKRKWKGGRYGSGQLVLLADQDLLLVLSEKGELVLVSATPNQFSELARFPAIEGKTWNHPVLVGDVLLVRNGQEMAAFRLSLVSG